MKSLCFTGHREFTDGREKGREERLRVYLEKLLTTYVEEKGVTTFYAGGASGFDNFAASCVINVRKKHPEVKLIVVLPFSREDMSAKWSAKDRKLLMNVCKLADQVVEEIGRKYSPGCYKKRNQYMVNHADHCLAWYDEEYKEKSGTGQTVRMALRKGIEVENIYRSAENI